ncbi:MAG: ankyrin repeat domain-containing protein [Rubripirellula sp.]
MPALIKLAKDRDWNGLAISLGSIAKPLPRSQHAELFVRSVVSGDTTLLAKMLSLGISPNAAWNTYTPLTTACELLDAKVIRWLLKQGADVKKKGYDQATGLIAIAKLGLEWDDATLREEGVRIARLLVKSGCSVNARDVVGRTALDYAFESNWLALTKLLVRSGAKLRYCEDGGAMAGFYMVRMSDTSDACAQYLQAGGKPTHMVTEDLTVLDWAQQCGRRDLVQMLT